MNNIGVGLKARVEAFFEEFPFLRKYVDMAMVGENPRVSRVNLELLDDSGWTLNWTKYRVEFESQAQGEKLFFILNMNGEQLTSVKPTDAISVPRKDKLWGIFTRKPLTTIVDSESVSEAIRRLPDPNKIRYIVEVEDRRSGWKRELYPEASGYSVIVYKVPAGESFSSWLSRLRGIAKQELSVEIGKIDQLK